jgi:hypothetical protein
MGHNQVKDINIKVIPHERQSYRTVGDYWETLKSYEIRVSRVNKSDYEYLVAFHELVELYLCKKHGVKFEDITSFDKLYQAETDKGLHSPGDEPGEDPRAPYHKEHMFACEMENMMGDELEVDMMKYEETLTKKYEEDNVHNG